jgi:hypothetical protein
VAALWFLYAAGVLVGLWRIDARPITKVALALVWPIGPMAFVLTILVLLGASAVAFPLVGVGLAVAAAVAWWALAA